MTRTVLENALLLQAIAGNDGIDDRSFGSSAPQDIPKYYDSLVKQLNPRDLAGVRIGVVTESLHMPGMDPRVLGTFNDTVERFKHLGALVENVSVPMHSHGAAIWTAISKCGGTLGKTGLAFGRRGFVLNDLGALLCPLKEGSWNNFYPR